MSASTRESTAAPTSTNLPAQTIDIAAQKRPLSEDGESGVRKRNKKRKRDPNSANLESNSSVVAAASASHSLSPVATHHSTYTSSPSHRKEKDKKKKKKKRRKMSIVTNSEFEDDRTKHKHTTNGGVPPTSTISITSQQSTMLGRTKPDAKDMSDIESLIAFRNNIEKKKGKDKALSPSLSAATHNPPMSRGRSPMVDSAAQVQIDSLKQQLEAQSQLLKKHQTHLTGIQQSLTCQICLDLLYKPFALAPCGHVACYGCLVRWFTSPGAGENTPDNQHANQNVDATHGVTGNHIYKRKTCPICRALVFERPVEVWGMKDMVNALVRSKLVDVIPSASAEEASTSTDQSRATQASGSRTRTGADPWHKIFRPARNSYGNHGPWWHDWVGDPDAAPDRVEGALEEVGMYDAEDHIHRCLDCMHEIWGGRCSHCDRAYPGHPEADGDEDTSDSDEVMDSEEDYREDEIEYGLTLGEILDRIHGRQDRDQPMWDLEEEEEEEEFFTDEEDPDWGDDPVYGGAVVWHDADDEEPGFARVEEVRDNEEQEDQEEDEDGYESSFIDDGGGHENDVIDVGSTSDEGDAENVREAARHMGRAVRLDGPGGGRRGVRRVVTSEDEGERQGQRRSTRRGRR